MPFTLHLASGSPRRAELLTRIGIAFTRVAADTDETVRPGETPADHVRRVALAKARAGWTRLPATPPGTLVLGADTSVTVDDAILGKPRDRAAGAAMLRRLSGRAHRVLTAVALLAPDPDAPDGARADLDLSVSTVHFRDLDPAEIDAYWDSGEPADKAGGYAIQGLGALFVARLDGSHSGVMGLPLFETGRLLARAGWHPLSRAASETPFP